MSCSSAARPTAGGALGSSAWAPQPPARQRRRSQPRRCCLSEWPTRKRRTSTATRGRKAPGHFGPAILHLTAVQFQVRMCARACASVEHVCLVGEARCVSLPRAWFRGLLRGSTHACTQAEKRCRTRPNE
eukprot:6936887-Alexandrium_andersonii.AAC.1